MRLRSTSSVLLIFLVLLLTGAYLLEGPDFYKGLLDRFDRSESELSFGEIVFQNGTEIKVEIADSSKERSQGLLLDGKKIWAADHKQQSLMEIGSDLAELGQDMPGLDFAAWWMGQKPSADSLSLISDEKEHPGLTGLQIDDFEMTTVTWFNEKGIPQVLKSRLMKVA